MELEDKENGDVIEGEDQLGWSFFILGFSLLNALHMSFSRRNEYAWNKHPPAMRVETNTLYEKNTFPLQ